MIAQSSDSKSPMKSKLQPMTELFDRCPDEFEVFSRLLQRPRKRADGVHRVYLGI